MAIFKDLPNELIYKIISEVAQLSYRDRARVACVSKECKRIADDPVSYRAQYIRDFGRPPQKPEWIDPTVGSHGVSNTIGRSGFEPPILWTTAEDKSERNAQESSWKRAYIRCHNPYFPQEMYTSRPTLPYKKKHQEIEHKHRLDAYADHLTPKNLYLYLLTRKSLLGRSQVVFHAIRHGVHPGVDAFLAHMGWLLCWGAMELDETNGNLLRWRGRPSTMMDVISQRNLIRQGKLQKAETGARSGMAQVPIEFESYLEGENFSR